MYSAEAAIAARWWDRSRVGALRTRVLLGLAFAFFYLSGESLQTLGCCLQRFYTVATDVGHNLIVEVGDEAFELILCLFGGLVNLVVPLRHGRRPLMRGHTSTASLPGIFD